MDFRYSDIIDPSVYDAQGLCDGIPLRRNRDHERETTGAMRAQHDWAQIIGPIGEYHGNLATPYGFMQLCIPECRPERVEIASYATEFAFLYDDFMEKRDQDKVFAVKTYDRSYIDNVKSTKRDRQILDVFGDGVLLPDASQESLNSGRTSSVNGHKQLQFQILTEMSAIDAERALTSMKAWATWVQLSTSRKRSEPFTSLEEYIPYRIMDVGETIWLGFTTFGMALTIPEKEMDLCKQLVRPAMTHLLLVNDLFSWERERDSAKEDGRSYAINAIWVLMNELSVSEDEAKIVCRRKIKECVAEYLPIVQETKFDSTISQDLRTYVEALQYAMSGNTVWSTYCPRYHPDATNGNSTLSKWDAAHL